MASTPVQLASIDEILSAQNGPLTKLYKVAAPNTTIVNRALVTDFSKDLLPKFGPARTMFEALQEVQAESGANGERIFKPMNDVHDQVRFIGAWTNVVGSSGAGVQTFGDTAASIEIVFYGTGASLVLALAGSGNSLSYSLDGAAEVALISAAAYSSVISGRLYPPNQVLTVVNNLTQGMHTVKIRDINGGTMNFYGYEVLTEKTALQLAPGVSYIGGRKLSKAALTTNAYNSNFESGSLGTKGGHVVVYQKADGSSGMAVQPTDVTQLNLTAASHVNEDVIKIDSWRNFGAGRSDDFSLVSGTGIGQINFVLDDGTTTLSGNALQVTNTFGPEVIGPSASGSFISFTFVGSGLDIIAGSAATTIDPHTITIDGVSIGTISTVPAAGLLSTVKIVSGLSHGTHIFKMTRTASPLYGLNIARLVTYGAKKPAVPAGAVEVADYFLMGNFSANTAGTIAPSAGVLRKSALREFSYTGTWTAAGVDPGFASGQNINTTTAGSYIEYPFFGSSVELKTFFNPSVALNWTLSIDGSTTLTSYTTAIYSAATGTITLNTSTGVISGTSGSASSYGTTIAVSGLALGWHKVRLTYNSGTNMYADCLDIGTPLHSPKSNLPGDLQNTLTVGSNAIGDSRKFGLQSVKALSNWGQAVGVTTTPTTTATSYVPLADMVVPLRTTGNPCEIKWSISVYNSVSGTIVAAPFVDGVQVAGELVVDFAAGNFDQVISGSSIVPVAAGQRLVQIYWKTSTGTASCARRIMNAKENT